jgi:hypothetical protein
MISTITLLIKCIASGPGRRRIATTKVQYWLHAFHVTILNHLDQNVKCKIISPRSALKLE